MPKAIAEVEDTSRRELKSLPGGFVVLRRMTYGQFVQRRAMMKLSVATTGRNKDFRGEMAMASEEIARFEFSHCIVDHNLEDEHGQKLNFSSLVDFNRLDPRVGQEIEGFISEMNNFEEDDEELGN